MESLLHSGSGGGNATKDEAQLNCVSLRSRLDCEVSYAAVKGQDERRPAAAPLTAAQVTIGRPG